MDQKEVRGARGEYRVKRSEEVELGLDVCGRDAGRFIGQIKAAQNGLDGATQPPLAVFGKS